MTHKERFDFYREKGLTKLTPEAVAEQLINDLLKSLRIPVKSDKNITKLDKVRIEHFNLDLSEPINWADLSCTVEHKDGKYIATIEEAEPGGCPILCGFIEEYMDSWGWDVEAKTEW